ncbi:MAG TPA: DNA translocase FtsK 4TM domain-containing protein [Polyangia bacterium]|nr:DNA translocase FtsK 4TM domain-containing protein [Polyangia bacterium]
MSARALHSSRARSEGSRGREVFGILLLSLSIFLAVSLLSLLFADGTWLGPGGLAAATALYSVLGLGSLFVAVTLGRTGVRVLLARAVGLKGIDTFGAVLAVVAGCVLLDVICAGARLAGYAPGGMLGAALAQMSIAIFFRAGTALVALAALAVGLVLACHLSFRVVGRWIGAGARLFWRAAIHALSIAGSLMRLMLPTRDEILGRSPTPGALPDRKRKKTREEQEAEAVPVEVPDHRTDETEKSPSGPEMTAPTGSAPAPEAAAHALAALPEIDDAPTPKPVIVLPDYRRTRKERKREERIEDRPQYIKSGSGDYELPKPSLLDWIEPAHAEADRQAMYETAERLVKTLGHFGITGQVKEIRPGPVVTMYEFVPAPGTKISKIVSLANDLAMNLEAISVRIVAPIPGKAAVGIEVPNKRRETVYLREVLLDDAFRSIKSKIALALGKDIEGRPAAVDLGRMPHLLVAGTTGAGKSVSVNAMIMSIVCNATPEDVRFIMIDPKMLELSIYEGIPHLLLPVVTDPKKANLALRWAVEEMERRYELLAKAGVRDIGSYNRKIARALEAVSGGSAPTRAAAAQASRDRRIKVVVTAADGSEQEVEVEAEEEAEAVAAAALPEAEPTPQLTLIKSEEPAPRRLPYIVVVIDEFADLMMVASKEVEAAVMRIAQKARAAGIHLLLATQRPSVDVITGVIKANFPSRIAFQVPSKMDSKVILDQHGAESLLGQGDMLFTDRGLPLRRIHGALVGEEEIRRVVDHLKAQGKPVYDLDILKPRADESEDGEPVPDDDDPSYEQALQLLHEMRQISVSMIQRRLRIGYNRAARIVERMERDGFVGAADGAKPREVLRAPAF